MYHTKPVQPGASPLHCPDSSTESQEGGRGSLQALLGPPWPAPHPIRQAPSPLASTQLPRASFKLPPAKPVFPLQGQAGSHSHLPRTAERGGDRDLGDLRAQAGYRGGRLRPEKGSAHSR